MEVIRRNTDYALRLMVNLMVNNNKGYISSRNLAKEEDVSYQLACKLLQKLSTAGLIKSRMGVNGGFTLNKPPAEISLLEIIEIIQGPIFVNRCLLNDGACKRRNNCPITKKISGVQEYINTSLKNVCLEDLKISRS